MNTLKEERNVFSALEEIIISQLLLEKRNKKGNKKKYLTIK